MFFVTNPSNHDELTWFEFVTIEANKIKVSHTKNEFVDLTVTVTHIHVCLTSSEDHPRLIHIVLNIIIISTRLGYRPYLGYAVYLEGSVLWLRKYEASYQQST